MIARRAFLIRVAGLLPATGVVRRLAAQRPALTGTPITIYKSSNCGCCAKWVEHVRGAGFQPAVLDQEDMDKIKDGLGVPKAVRSCHTAVVDKYLIEGHVPATEIRRLLAAKPKLMGLAVPGMPSGTPGMAPAGEPVSGFEVLGFQQDGTTRSFARY
jgi:hypothetical protein